MYISNRYIFVYGTLLLSDNIYSAYLKDHCKYIDKGKLKGSVYDAGAYPGAIADNKARGYVHGSVYLMDDAHMVLKFLDEYEGIGTEKQAADEYRRITCEIVSDSRTTLCWVYLYNQSVAGFVRVTDGDYVAYIKNKML